MTRSEFRESINRSGCMYIMPTHKRDIWDVVADTGALVHVDASGIFSNVTISSPDTKYEVTVENLQTLFDILMICCTRPVEGGEAND